MLDRSYYPVDLSKQAVLLKVEPTVSFFPGVYLISGETASGKSLNAAALAMAFDRSMPDRTTYLYVNEPRGKLMTPETFENTVKNLTGKTMIVDSINFFMIKKGAMQGAGGTMAKGLSPAHVEFLMYMESIFVSNGSIGIFVMNETTFSVPDLEGAVEGKIRIQGIGNFSKRDRSFREFTNFSLPEKDVKDALEVLNYSSSMQGARASGFDKITV